MSAGSTWRSLAQGTEHDEEDSIFLRHDPNPAHDRRSRAWSNRIWRASPDTLQRSAIRHSAPRARLAAAPMFSVFTHCSLLSTHCYAASTLRVFVPWVKLSCLCAPLRPPRSIRAHLRSSAATLGVLAVPILISVYLYPNFKLNK